MYVKCTEPRKNLSFPECIRNVQGMERVRHRDAHNAQEIMHIEFCYSAHICKRPGDENWKISSYK